MTSDPYAVVYRPHEWEFNRRWRRVAAGATDQEDSPDGIGGAIASWSRRLG